MTSWRETLFGSLFLLLTGAAIGVGLQLAHATALAWVGWAGGGLLLLCGGYALGLVQFLTDSRAGRPGTRFGEAHRRRSPAAPRALPAPRPRRREGLPHQLSPGAPVQQLGPRHPVQLRGRPVPDGGDHGIGVFDVDG